MQVLILSKKLNVIVIIVDYLDRPILIAIHRGVLDSTRFLLPFYSFTFNAFSPLPHLVTFWIPKLHILYLIIQGGKKEARCSDLVYVSRPEMLDFGFELDPDRKLIVTGRESLCQKSFHSGLTRVLIIRYYNTSLRWFPRSFKQWLLVPLTELIQKDR